MNSTILHWITFYALILPVFCQDECPTAPQSLEDRRVDKNRLRIATFNTFFLFDGVNDPIAHSWKTPQLVDDHVKNIAATIKRIDADIICLEEVENCDMIDRMTKELPSNHTFKHYLKKGTDTITGEQVALLSRVDPIQDLIRYDKRADYPVSGNKCDADSSLIGTSSMSKNYYTVVNAQPFGRIAIIGVHLLARPTQQDRCLKREAQAQLIIDMAKSLYPVAVEGLVIMGDFNDYSSENPDVKDNTPNSRVLEMVKAAIPGQTLFEVTSLIPHSDRYSHSSHSQIDHILLSPNLAKYVTKAWIDHGETGSDHFPVIVELVSDSVCWKKHTDKIWNGKLIIGKFDLKVAQEKCEPLPNCHGVNCNDKDQSCDLYEMSAVLQPDSSTLVSYEKEACVIPLPPPLPKATSWTWESWRYEYIPVLGDFAASKKICEDKHSHLLTIHSEAEWDAAIQSLPQSGVTMWTALVKSGTSGTLGKAPYNWLDGTEYYGGLPDDMKGDDCVKYQPDAKQLVSVKCDETHAVICRRKLVLINEIESDTKGTDTDEFVELIGEPNYPLDDYVLVFWDGSKDVSYWHKALDTFKTDKNGYFTIGSNTLQGVDFPAFTSASKLQNGPDAVALYFNEHHGGFSFPDGTKVSSATDMLVDIVVYGSTSDPELEALLDKGQTAANEDDTNSELDSLQRCPNGVGVPRRTAHFVAVPPTLGQSNQCGECSNPLIPLNGIRQQKGTGVCAYSQTCTFFPDEILDYSCKTGYTLQGAASIKCKSDGKWDNPTPSCSPDLSPPTAVTPAPSSTTPTVAPPSTPPTGSVPPSSTSSPTSTTPPTTTPPSATTPPSTMPTASTPTVTTPTDTNTPPTTPSSTDPPSSPPSITPQSSPQTPTTPTEAPSTPAVPSSPTTTTTNPSPTPTQPSGSFNPITIGIIAGTALIPFILAAIVILMLRKRSKKRKLMAEQQAQNNYDYEYDWGEYDAEELYDEYENE